MTRYTISCFGDEIADDLEEQLTTMQQLQLSHLDLRAAWGTNVLRMTDHQVSQVKSLCQQYDVKVVCIGSPIGKSPLNDPIENELQNLDRIMDICSQLNTRYIRIFSFYPEDTSTNQHYDQYVGEVVDRLTRLAQSVQERGLTLLLENEKEVVGDTPDRVHRIMEAIDHPSLQLIWDPANFVQVRASEQVDTWWEKLSPHIGYIHIKDARLADGSVCPAGEGDGQLEQLLRNLAANGYDGVLSLEPHLVVAGHSGGFSGSEGMAIAVRALRDLLKQLEG